MKNRTSRPDRHEASLGQFPVDEHEWLAQERAARAERLGILGEPDEDPLVARYRDLSRALREPRADGLPANFAKDLARHVAIDYDARADGFERVVLHAMTALLGLFLGVICVIYGPTWAQAIGQETSERTLQWAALVASCTGLHWALDRWRLRRATH